MRTARFLSPSNSADLRRRVTIASHPEYRAWVEGYGIGYKEIGGDPAALMKLSVEHKMASRCASLSFRLALTSRPASSLLVSSASRWATSDTGSTPWCVLTPFPRVRTELTRSLPV